MCPCFFNYFILRDILFFCASTLNTRTLIISPIDKTSSGCLIRRWDISEICTRPSTFTPKSINAPKSTTLRTTPSNSIPVLISSRLKTSCRKIGGGTSSRGSRPGRSRASTISLEGSRPASSSSALFLYPETQRARSSSCQLIKSPNFQ